MLLFNLLYNFLSVLDMLLSIKFVQSAFAFYHVIHISIACLILGSKSHDPTKTGQYGVGFSSVYHLTDAPSILTTVPGEGAQLCVFDPQCAYVPGATTSEPGMRCGKLHSIFKKYL